MHRPLRTGLAIAVASAIATTGAQAATKTPKPVQVYACLSTAKHTLSIISKSKSCAKGKTKVSWTTNAPTPAAGATGATGATGAPGAPGAPGAAGSPDTPQQVLTKLKTVDGAGSGLDADTLAGVSLNSLQSRVTGTCTGGQAIGSVNADGSVGCTTTIPDGVVSTAKLKLPLNIDAGSNTPAPLSVTTESNGNIPSPQSDAAIAGVVNNTNSVAPALYGSVNTIFGNFGAAGVWGQTTGTGGVAVLAQASNTSGNGAAVVAINSGNGNAVTANVDKDGNGVESSIDGAGMAMYGWVPSFSTGRAARFRNFNSTNSNPAAEVDNAGTGTALLVNHTGSSGNPVVVQTNGTNVARIDRTGKGFFNGGTQASGADLAEVVPTCSAAKPSEVVEIDTTKPNCFRLATHANSKLVAGVVSTKPGMTLNATASQDKAGPALALAGRVPVKVTGKIAIGDLLVASSVPGHAQAAPAHPEVGTVIGKALEASSGKDGTITMLVLSR